MENLSVSTPPREAGFQVKVERTRSPRPKPDGTDLGFGRFFTDHELESVHDGRAWSAARIVPFGSTKSDVASGAVQYGLSVFEGLKVFRGADGALRIFRADAHARRFAKSAEAFCMPAVPQDMFIAAVRALTREDAAWHPGDPGSIYVRPTLFGSEEFLGVRPSHVHTFSVILSPVGSYFGAGARPLRLWAEKEYVRACVGGVGWVKTGGNYAASLRAAERARSRGFDQVLWLDAVHHEHVEEAGTMNVFVRIGDRVTTPPLGGSILAGVTRDSSLTLLRAWGIEVEERALTLAEITEAARSGKELEIWGTGTAAVVSSIGEISWDGGSVKAESTTVATRLRNEITAIQTGRAEDTHGWLTLV
jgi:branched-chain amino acid aminotransferase